MKPRIALFAALCALSLTALAAPPGAFGMSLNLKASGWFLNPTIDSLTIDAVTPNRPAANAHIAPGDEVLEMDGHVVAGAKANDLKPLLHKSVGETLRLKLKRKTGEIYSVILTAVPKLN